MKTVKVSTLENGVKMTPKRRLLTLTVFAYYILVKDVKILKMLHHLHCTITSPRPLRGGQILVYLVTPLSKTRYTKDGQGKSGNFSVSQFSPSTVCKLPLLFYSEWQITRAIPISVWHVSVNASGSFHLQDLCKYTSLWIFRFLER